MRQITRLSVPAFILLISPLATLAAEAPEPWNDANDPGRWSTQYTYDLSQLPLQGQIAQHTPWSDTYWPSYKGGIADRWNWDGQDAFTYVTYSEAEVRAMSHEELARLSPAEKYDIYEGRFDYPTVAAMRAAHSRRDPSWTGICHGWAPAALNHAEPSAITATSRAGITIPFGSDDIKALIDQYYADHAKAVHFLGARCGIAEMIGNEPLRDALELMHGSRGCNGVNAGALHLVLSNELGLRSSGFIADIDRSGQIWNQPVYSFHAVILGSAEIPRDAAPGTASSVRVQADMQYAKEITPNWNPVVGTADFRSATQNYDYTLELDGQGHIVGGTWISPNRPAFLWWTPKLEFEGYFGDLKDLYRAAE